MVEVVTTKPFFGAVFAGNFVWEAGEFGIGNGGNRHKQQVARPSAYNTVLSLSYSSVSACICG